MKSALRVFTLLFCSQLLLGCSDGGSFQDLELYIAEVKAKPKRRIEPLPEFEAYQAFTYSAANRRSPFLPPQPVRVVNVEDKPKNSVKPDFDRSKELLESFALAQLAMVGTINRSGQSTLFALVNDDQGGIHRIRIGQYLGKNHGKVIDVRDSGVDLVEIVSDGQGGWFERPRTLALKEQ